MCVMQTGVIFFRLLGSGGRQLKHLSQMSTSSIGKEWSGWCVQQGVPNNAISAPKLANVLVHLFQVGLAWCTIGIYHSAISAFLEPYHLHKASNHPVISKLMCHFYLQCPPSNKHFDPWDVEHLLSLLESWRQLLLSLLLCLLGRLMPF